MANPVFATLQLSAAVANGIATSQSGTGGTALTLNGSYVTSGVATLPQARRVLITSGGNDSGITFAIVGTDRRGYAISETLTGGNATGVYTQQDFLTVTKITPSGNTATTVTSGTNGVGSTDWFGWSMQIAPFQLGLAVIPGSGCTVSVEHTYDDPNSQQSNSVQPNSNFPPVPWTDPLISAVTTKTQGAVPATNATGQPDVGVVFASRMTQTAGTTLSIFQAIQAGIANF